MVERSSLDYRHANVNPSGEFRILLVSLLAAFIEIPAGFVAYGLYSLIIFNIN